MSLGRWYAGSTPSLGRVDARAGEARRNRGLKVDPRTGLELVKMPWGQLLRRTRKPAIYATIGGTAPNYTFVAAEDDGDGSWSASVGSGDCYEVNNVAGLAGTRQYLRPDRWGKWRFQDVRYGALPPATGTVRVGIACGGPSTITLYRDGVAVASAEAGAPTAIGVTYVVFSGLAAGHTYSIADPGYPPPRYRTTPASFVVPDTVTYSWSRGFTVQPGPGYVCYYACTGFALSDRMVLDGVPGAPVTLSYRLGSGSNNDPVPGSGSQLGWYGEGPGPDDGYYGGSQSTIRYALYWDTNFNYWVLNADLWPDGVGHGFPVSYIQDSAGTGDCADPFELTFAQFDATYHVTEGEAVP